jgi:adenosylmethionine-8-amino-7-oxononanoate aminotransferase
LSSVFHRAADLPVAVSAEGVWITDVEGRRYLDACAGAIVNGVGHGRREVAEAISRQLVTLDYVHAHSFTSPIVEEYAARLADHLPLSDARVFPVAGGSEATETALKLVRSYHLAKGAEARSVVLSRRGSYHGNTIGALDVSGREGLRRGYEPWLGRFAHVAAVNEYRCPNETHPHGCAEWHAQRLEQAILEIGPERVAAFVAEPIGGATLGAAVPPEGYWEAVIEVCRRHDVLVIADEVMTGFGRTGAWFAIEHFLSSPAVTPDIVIMAKGASSGYWPLGICAASGEVADTADPVFDHGYTYSHHPGGAAAGMAVLGILESESLVARSAELGARLKAMVASALGSHPNVGDVRGRGLLVGVEFVSDRGDKRPFPAAERLVDRLRSAAIARGVIPYPVSGCANGVDGDGLLLGPPLTVTEGELTVIVSGIADAVGDVLG